MSITISKTDYALFINCPKSLWLKKNTKSQNIPKSDFEQLKIDEGHWVGQLAHQHPSFASNSVLISTLITQDALEETSLAIKNPQIKVIFEAAFSVVIEGVLTLVRCDILEKINSDEVLLTEVKSSTKLKDKYLHDVAFQKKVIEACGIKVSKTQVMLINKAYVLKEKINTEEYFYKENVSHLLAPFEDNINRNLSQIRELLKIKKEISYPQGPHCYQSFECPYLNNCEKPKSLDDVDNLRNLHFKKKEILNQNNITQISKIPDEILFNLTETQQLQVLCAKKPNTIHLEAHEINTQLSLLKYPLHFLDFESFLSAIPYFQGMKPHSFVTYQASIHTRNKPNEKITHNNFLEKTKNNPHLNLMSFLKKTIQKKGSIIVYHKQFEQARLEDLKKEFPEDSLLIDSWISRLWDLEVIFKNFWIYSHEQAGSTSLKKVLPTIVKNLSYDNLAIKDGNVSVAKYLKLLNTLDAEGQSTLINDLCTYNDLDTFCMVKILNKLKWLCRKNKDHSTSKIPA